jgi:pimeloyl-ACP methyl ester carboxylesterase
MRHRLGALLIVLAAGEGLIACDSERQAVEEAVVQVPEDSFVTVNGIRLHYLDWGGPDPAFVLVHGALDSPHIFDQMASALRNDFRVITYARRGHGRSEARDPFDNPTFVEDLRQLLDSLGIEEAHLLGWSMGGNEITEFAGRYPERTLKLVYLEAGYDWSDPAFWAAFEKLPIAFEPDSADLQSLDLYRAWYRETMMPGLSWTPGLEAFLRDNTRIAPGGSVQVIPDSEVTEKIFGALATTPRDYTAVQAPTLAMYSPSFFETDLPDPEDAQAMTAWEQQLVEPFRRASIERIRQELPGVIIREIPNTTHISIGLVNQESLVETIGDFLQQRQ